MSWVEEAKEQAKATAAPKPAKVEKLDGLPKWLTEADSSDYDGAKFIKTSTNKAGANNLDSKKQVCIIPSEIQRDLDIAGVSNQNAIASLLVWGMKELKRQGKTLVLDFSDYGKTKK